MIASYILDQWIVIAVIVFVAVIQSIFGVGLLLIGTPLLIIFGIEYQQALSCLLPSSILISALQIFSSRPPVIKQIPFFCIYGIPSVALGAVIYYLNYLNFNIIFFVGCMLILSAIARLSSRITLRLRGVIDRHNKVFIVFVGLLHGYSNMGGTLLTIWASFQSDSKKTIRENIAQGYIIFAITQLGILFLMGNFYLSTYSMFAPLLAFLSYALIGRASFNFINQNLYQSALSIMMIAMGSYLLLKAFGWAR